MHPAQLGSPGIMTRVYCCEYILFSHWLVSVCLCCAAREFYGRPKGDSFALVCRSEGFLVGKTSSEKERDVCCPGARPLCGY